MSFAIKIDATGVKRLLGRVSKQIDDIAYRETRRAGDEFLNTMRDRARGGGGSGLHVRTGLMRQSFTKVLTRKPGGGVKLVCLSVGVIYINPHEYGAVIRPKAPRRWLAIPIEDNLTKAGVPRYSSPRDFMARYGAGFRGNRNFEASITASRLFARAGGDHAFIFTSKSGKKYIVLQRASGELLFLWRLVRQVVIPGRLRWNQHFNELSAELPDRIIRSVSDFITQENAKL